MIEAIGLTLAVCTCACGTTVIAPQPGHEWCVEVQGPRGSVSDPESFDQFIVDPDTGMDPRGCLCFSTADDHTLDAGLEAEQSGAPLPAGYEDLREQIVAAARLRCTEAALASEPPLMYTDCLSADVSLPYRPPNSANCTICIQADVWSGSQQEVDCPPGLEDATAGGPGTSAAETTKGNASADETGASDSSGAGLQWIVER